MTKQALERHLRALRGILSRRPNLGAEYVLLKAAHRSRPLSYLRRAAQILRGKFK